MPLLTTRAPCYHPPWRLQLISQNPATHIPRTSGTRPGYTLIDWTCPIDTAHLTPTVPQPTPHSSRPEVSRCFCFANITGTPPQAQTPSTTRAANPAIAPHLPNPSIAATMPRLPKHHGCTQHLLVSGLCSCHAVTRLRLYSTHMSSKHGHRYQGMNPASLCRRDPNGCSCTLFCGQTNTHASTKTTCGQ